ncbi:MAG: ribbon-helix-helix protein, CopG family [Candidatus Micrarchaeota archaeon]
MGIISISLDDKTLKDLNETQKLLGFKSRSKLLRGAIDSLTNEYRKMEAMKGHTDGVLVITYKEQEKHRISDLRHGYTDCIKTVIHQHHVGVCLEVLITCADAGRVRELFRELKKDRAVLSVSCSVI